jgi:dTDP-4-dehydrorhamnose reductase
VKVLITGAGGQLGLDLVDAFAGEDVVGLLHRDLDVADEAAVAATVAEHAPDLLVNAAAWTAVDACEEDEDRAHRVNALGPWWLARACDRVGATLVHLSTDYVFPGTAPRLPDGSPRPWSEFDPILPVNAYGRSKAAGEALVRSAVTEHHIVRTSWVNGARGDNFVRTMLRLAGERDHVDVVDDEIGSPTFTRDLAAAIRELTATGRYGTVHRTNQGACSWYELACETFELAGAQVEVRPTTAARFARPAPRPSWSVLGDRHARAMGLAPLPPWRDGLVRLLTELGRDADPTGRRPVDG